VRREVTLAAAVVLAAAGGVAGGYWLAEHNLLGSWFAARQVPDSHAPPAAAPARGEPAKERKVLFYKDPMGGPDTSPVPKKDPMGMDYVPVYAEDGPGATPAPSSASGPAHQHGEAAPGSEAASGSAGRKILYYRNPMVPGDTSPVPKKDPMGMDYVPVYADEAEAANSGIVKINPGRVQQIGAKSEPVGRRNLVRPIRAVGTVQFDERRTFVVSTRFEGWIEKLLVNATGETVRRGQPLMQVYSPDLVLAQQEYALLRQSARGDGSADGENAATRRLLEGAEQRLRYLDFPGSEMERLKREAEPRSIVTIPSPVSGTVIEKPALQGMRFMPGEPLYKIVDMSTVWLIADVFEQDLGDVRIGQEAMITLKAYPARTFKGRVAFIYPTVGAQTRTARVRIEIPNPDGMLKADMYASVEIASSVGRDVLAVPDSAVIDNGVRQLVLIDRGEGRFEPRPVRLGDRGDGYVEVLEGVSADDKVVVSANFLIDAESNLKAALSGFGGGEHQHQ
jgi:membrane fusion protein, copper/silver efflux system